MKKRIILVVGAILALSGCGGGSSGGGSAPSGSAGDGGYIAPDSRNCLSAGLTLTPDCEGANCGSSNMNYTGSGIGVWVANNKGSSDQMVDVGIWNLSGQNIYFVYTNWGDSKRTLTTNPVTTTAVLGNWMPDSVESTAENTAPSAVRALVNGSQNSWTWKVINPSTRESVNAVTTKRAEASLSWGGKVYIWVANDQKQITNAQVQAVLERFVGSSGRKSIFDLGRAWVGEPWGDHTKYHNYNNLVSPSVRDIHIVISDIPAAGYVGYFDSENNLTKAANSNEALAIFIDGPELISTTDTTWTPITKKAMNVFSTVAHEFQHMIHYYEKTIKHKVAVSETWLDELAASMFQFYYLALDQDELKVVDGPEYIRIADWVNTPTCQLDAWKTTAVGCTFNASYGHVGAFGAFLLRHYGPSLIKGIVQNDKTDIRALETALGGSHCLADAQRRWGASLAMKGTAFPANYGFPAVTKNGASFQAFNLHTLNKKPSIYSSLPPSVNANSSVVVHMGKKTSRYETRVRVPAYSSLTVVVQP